MAASSNINTLLIDNTFPIPNKSQSSQGFRTNWTSIQTNFNYAKSDILNLQNKTITVTGDVTGTSPIFDSTASGITFSISLEPSGLDSLTPGSFISEFENIIDFTVDNRGLITEITSTPRETTFSSTGTVTAKSFKDQSQQYKGITSLSIPNISYNEYGLITSITDNVIDGFGVTDLYMPANSILFGNTSNISSFLPAPSSQSVLVYNGENISWQEVATIASVEGGNMIYSNISTTGVLAIQVTYTELEELTTLPTSSLIAVYNGTDYNTIKISDLTSNIENNLTTKVFTDKAPQLGGNLDVNNFEIINSVNGEIALVGKDIKLTGSNSVRLNSLIFPDLTLPTVDSILSVDVSGNVSLVSNTSLMDSQNNLTKITLTEDNQSESIISTTSLNYFFENVGYTNLNLVFDRTNYNTNTSYNLIYNIYFEITSADMILNVNGDSSSTVYLNGSGTVTTLTLTEGNIYKITAEYYGNNCWIMNVDFKATKTS